MKAKYQHNPTLRKRKDKRKKIMTAEKFIKENVITINQMALKQHYHFLPSIKKAMIEYAKSKCKQQREIIAKKMATDFDDNYLSEVCINSIEPEFD